MSPIRASSQVVRRALSPGHYLDDVLAANNRLHDITENQAVFAATFIILLTTQYVVCSKDCSIKLLN